MIDDRIISFCLTQPQTYIAGRALIKFHSHILFSLVRFFSRAKKWENSHKRNNIRYLSRPEPNTNMYITNRLNMHNVYSFTLSIIFWFIISTSDFCACVKRDSFFFQTFSFSQSVTQKVQTPELRLLVVHSFTQRVHLQYLHPRFLWFRMFWWNKWQEELSSTTPWLIAHAWLVKWVERKPFLWQVKPKPNIIEELLRII